LSNYTGLNLLYDGSNMILSKLKMVIIISYVDGDINDKTMY